MLRIRQNSHAAGAKSYYGLADYYLEGQELPGLWRGEGARRLGLNGEVQKEHWDALCDNLHPQTGEQLTARMRSDRTIGYDFNFHVPKSLSLLYATTGDERILDAVREAVDGTMHDVEKEMSARVRKNGKNEDRLTKNLTWGEFIHFTSRPVDGVPDPHLHAHCFVFNSTWDEQDRMWKAGQFRELKRDAPYFEAAFHSHLAGRLADLGLPIVRTKNGWELGGIEQSLNDKFSRRTKQIEAKAKEKGITNPEQKAELGAKTRSRKADHLSLSELRGLWRERMTEEERSILEALEKKIGGTAEPRDESAPTRAIDHAISHLFERKAVVPERQLLATALRHSVGQASLSQVLDQAQHHDLIVGTRNGRRMATTRDVLAEERALIDFARAGRGKCKPLLQKHKIRNGDLNAEQRAAVERLVTSRDRVTLLRGAAGVGKTSLMRETVEAIEGTGTHVVPLAPSAAASRGVLRNDGFETADTVARFLVDEKMQKAAAGQVIWIDEAGLLSTRMLNQVFTLAESLNARILLSGDRRQHGSVERGSPLRLLEDEAGLVPSEVKEIQRQKGAYKDAIHALSEGQAIDGYDRLDALGWIKEVNGRERYAALAAEYVETVQSHKSAIVVSPTHAEGDKITAEIRRLLLGQNLLGKRQRRFKTLVNAQLTDAEKADSLNYQTGDVLQYHQNATGHVRGERLTIEPGTSIPVDQARRYQVYHASAVDLAAGDMIRITQSGRTVDDHRLDNGSIYRIKDFDAAGNIVLANGWTIDKDWGHLTHGYVVTSHASQGRTVDRVFIGQSSESFAASSREQFYVSASRAREQVTVFTDDKQSLRDAIKRADSRISAVDLFGGVVHAPERQREAEPYQELKKEERFYER